MKKEYKCLASPKMALYMSLPIFWGMILGIWLLFYQCYELSVMDGICCVCWFMAGRNAFSITRIDSEGIHNRRLTLHWAEIKDFKIFDIRIKREIVKTKPFETVVGIGTFSGDSFLLQSTKKAVFFSLSKKNLEAIEQFCENKNETVEDLISWKNFTMRF